MNLGAYILILFAHVGPMGNGNSNALTVAYFETAEACQKAGVAAKNLTSGSVKRIEYVCASRK